MNQLIILSIFLVFMSNSVYGISEYWIKEKIGGHKRKCLVQVPSTLKNDKSKEAMLILVFHGGGGNSRNIARTLGFSRICEEKGVIVAYPEAMEGNWNDGRNSKLLWSQKNKIDDVGFVRFVVKKLEDEFKISPRRMYATGVSNGGIFCHYLAIRCH